METPVVHFVGASAAAGEMVPPILLNAMGVGMGYGGREGGVRLSGGSVGATMASVNHSSAREARSLRLCGIKESQEVLRNAEGGVRSSGCRRDMQGIATYPGVCVWPFIFV